MSPMALTALGFAAQPTWSNNVGWRWAQRSPAAPDASQKALGFPAQPTWSNNVGWRWAQRSPAAPYASQKRWALQPSLPGPTM